MIESSEIGYLIILSLAGMIFLFRRFLLTPNLISAFFYFSILFNCITLIIWGLSPNYFVARFFEFDLSVLTHTDYINASILTVGSVFIVLCSYTLSRIAFSGFELRPINFFSLGPIQHGDLNYRNFTILSGLLIAWSCFLLVRDLPVIVNGIIGGLFTGDYLAIISARRDVGGSYLRFVWFTNIMPIAALIAFTVAKVQQDKGKILLSSIATIMITLVAIGLVSSFLKSSLLIFLVLLLTVNSHVKACKLVPISDGSGTGGWSINLRQLLIISLIGFIVLMALYYIFGIGRQQGGNSLETMFLLSDVALSRIIGRLGLGSLYYVHIFPEIYDHYGFSNVATLMKLLGGEIFYDNSATYHHFNIDRFTTGNAAINSTIDFYGAFGWGGWLTGCIFLGILISCLDIFLSHLHHSVINIPISFYLIVFVYYLTQASLFRSVLGYGGIFFIGTWLLYRMVVLKKPNQPRNQ